LDEEVEGDLVRDMANYFGITKDDLLEFIDSPSAFLMADTGQIYPSMGYFVQLEEEQVEAAKKIVGAMDGYLDELVEMLNVFMPPESGLKDAIKKDSVIVKGGVVKRIYLDWEGLSPEILEMLRSQNVVDISDLKIELFYGVTGDKKFVVALYPDFQNRYLRDGLDKNEEFMKGIEAYNLDEAYEVFYFDTAETMDIVDRIVGVMEESGGMRGDDAKIYEEVKAAIETIDYMSIYGEFTDGMVMREGLMKIGE